MRYPLKSSLANLAARLSRVEVLIADPDRKISSLIKDVLQYLGFERIHIVENGQDALHHLRGKEVDLLITDWTMSPVDGVKLTQFLRSNPDSPNPYLPIIMLTGKAEVSDVMTARDSGITEFLVKPFTAKSLFERLVMVVENPRSFIASKEFNGPDRRRRMDIPPESSERRIHPPLGEL